MFNERGIKKELIDDKSAEVMAEQVLAFANEEFEHYRDYKVSLKKKFDELAGEMTAEDKEKVMRLIEGKRLFDYVFSTAEYEKVTNKSKDDRHHFPNYRDYEYAWSAVVPKESKKINSKMRAGAIEYAQMHMLADLVVNEMGEIKNAVNSESYRFLNACNKVFDHYGTPQKRRGKYTEEIASILDNRGTIKKEALRKQEKIRTAKRRPIFADQIQ